MCACVCGECVVCTSMHFAIAWRRRWCVLFTSPVTSEPIAHSVGQCNISASYTSRHIRGRISHTIQFARDSTTVPPCTFSARRVRRNRADSAEAGARHGSAHVPVNNLGSTRAAPVVVVGSSSANAGVQLSVSERDNRRHTHTHTRAGRVGGFSRLPPGLRVCVSSIESDNGACFGRDNELFSIRWSIAARKHPAPS